MKKVLVLCTGNSCRSQMAEGYLRFFWRRPRTYQKCWSGDTRRASTAIEIMAEGGIDISSHTSNHVDEYTSIDFDFVITVCDNAKERCPIFPGKAMTFHHDFPDPAKTTGTREEIFQLSDQPAI